MKTHIPSILLALLFLFPLSGAEKTRRCVIRAEDGLTELIKDEVLEVQKRSDAVFALKTEKSEHEILVISPVRETEAKEIKPYLRKGYLFLVHPRHFRNTILREDAEKLLVNQLTEWKKSGRKIRNIFYLKGILKPVPAAKGMPRQLAIPYADLAEKMLQEDPGAIAILPLDSLLSPQKAKILSVDGIMPDFESVTQDRYPMQKLYYIQRISDVPEAHELMTRLMARKFRKTILETGAIPVPDKSEKKK